MTIIEEMKKLFLGIIKRTFTTLTPLKIRRWTLKRHGKSWFNNGKICRLCRLFQNLHLRFSNFPLSIFRQRRKRGAILIEFAFSIPVLIVILFYALDYPKYNQLRIKAKNSAYMAASMIQTISRNRGNKTITANDIKSITHAALMNFYHGLQSVHLGDYKQPLGHSPLLFLACVKGLAGDKAKIIWTSFCFYWNTTLKTPLEALYFQNNNPNTLNFMDLKCSMDTEYDPAVIHPDLKIKDGEYKIILQAGLHTRTAYKYKDGKTISASNVKRLFDFYLLPFNPLGKPDATRSDLAFMFSSYSTVIFTPNVGLFSDTPPP